LKGRDHLGDASNENKKEKYYNGLIACEDMDWIHLTQDAVQWWAFVNTVINLQVL
jgi:hypothetical protein